MIAAFLLGLMGSLHCIGMCGPIAFALPRGSGARWKFLSGRILYNLGRVVTYSLLGGVIALIGVGARMFMMQQVVSIVMGVILLIWGLEEFGLIKLPMVSRVSGNISAHIRKGFGKWFMKGTMDSLFITGLLNGLLPCGFVYMGLFYAALAESPLHGMGVMVLFGMGTFPVMLGLSLSGPALAGRLRSKVNKLIPYTIIFVGLLFVLRGMALGIPYLSPKMHQDAAGKVEMSCCHPK